jgi:hypothetical protein
MMRKLILAAIAAGTALVAVSPAMAAQGCGPGGHRDYAGYCRPNGPGPGPGPAIVAGPLVIGTYYPHRGWWDGQHYWMHREHWRGGWRYH